MDWFETWFDTPYYHILYKNHDFQEAEAFITQLTGELKLDEGSKIIDLACGKGRHSIYLNKIGYDVLGMDLSRKSIEANRQFENDSLHFQVHDMRKPIMAPDVDAVFNLFTSFGYFITESDDYKVFQSVYDVLKKNGYFVLDYLNQQYVRNNLVPHEQIEREGIVFNINKSIDDNFIIKKINFSDQGQDYNFFERVKLHTPKKINDYAEEVGFERVKLWGDYQLNDFSEDLSPRCINLFVKK